MGKYLLKVLYLLSFSLLVAFVYYYGYNFHQESFNGYTPYIITMAIFYGVYKSIGYLTGAPKVIFTPMKILGYFLFQLFILCILFFTLNGDQGALGFTLFFKIIAFLILPTLFVFVSIASGKTLLEKIPGFHQESNVFQFLFSLGLGFFLLNTLLVIGGFFGYYNIYTVGAILAIGAGVSYKALLEIGKSLFTYQMIVDNHQTSHNATFFQKINFYLLSGEFFFIVLSFLISVNFINIVRPMPIGWDDLGVYMNYPNLMAAAGSILPLGMTAWQSFTGIGFMFGSATQSFFFNNVGGVLSVLVIILSFQDLLKAKAKTFLHIPLLAATIFAAMPMVIFQQAKDMKLDPGLFFISSIVVYLALYIFTKYLGYTDTLKEDGRVLISKETSPSEESIAISYKNRFFSYFKKYTHIGEHDIFSQKSYLLYLLLIGVLAGFAFSIKMTSLLLISGVLGVIFYSKMGMAGLLSYFTLYVGIFTKAGLWDMMFVVYPKDDIDFRNKFFLYSVLVGVLLLVYSIYKYSFKAFKKGILLVLLFCLGVGIGFSPWGVRNIVSLDSLSIGGILNGKGESFQSDYTKIYTQPELDAINKKYDLSLSINASGTTTNEDMGRYFGYEKGINNYLKLPYNLTMQANQRGEFTDITFLYFAIIPAIALFFAFQFEILSLGVFAMSLFPLGFFFHSGINKTITDIFTNFELPGGYIVIALFFLVPFFYFIYSLNREKLSVQTKINLVFMVFYIFLWSISAFGIVWYGITMYYSLLLFIATGLSYISSYHEQDEEKVQYIKLFGSLVVFFIVSIYFFQSSFPHGFNNIKTASYGSYKAAITDNYTSIFDSHSDYYDALVELNIAPEKRKDLLESLISHIKNEKLKNIIVANNINTLNSFESALKELVNMDNKENNLELITIKKEASILRSELYKNILYPKKEFKNEIGIYRIGTFLKYFIADNYKRLLEDSMVQEFEKYYYDANNTDIAIERMKKMGVGYFLVDLNAATIDRDPRHDLTSRYEGLLHTFTSNKIELIQTDSTCLKIALEDYNKSQKTPQDFQKYMTFAGVNYESYTSTGGVINRGEKQLECYRYILDLIGEKKIDEKNYTYLLPVAQYLEKNKIANQEQLVNFFRNYVSSGWMALFRIK